MVNSQFTPKDLRFIDQRNAISTRIIQIVINLDEFANLYNKSCLFKHFAFCRVLRILIGLHITSGDIPGFLPRLVGALQQ